MLSVEVTFKSTTAFLQSPAESRRSHARSSFHFAHATRLLFFHSPDLKSSVPTVILSLEVITIFLSTHFCALEISPLWAWMFFKRMFQVMSLRASFSQDTFLQQLTTCFALNCSMSCCTNTLSVFFLINSFNLLSQRTVLYDFQNHLHRFWKQFNVPTP